MENEIQMGLLPLTSICLCLCHRDRPGMENSCCMLWEAVGKPGKEVGVEQLLRAQRHVKERLLFQSCTEFCHDFVAEFHMYWLPFLSKSKSASPMCRLTAVLATSVIRYNRNESLLLLAKWYHMSHCRIAVSCTHVSTCPSFLKERVFKATFQYPKYFFHASGRFRYFFYVDRSVIPRLRRPLSHSHAHSIPSLEQIVHPCQLRKK